MIWPPAAKRRAAMFAASVEGHQPAGTLDADTAALVQLARRLESLDKPELRPEYAADLRLRLMEAEPVAPLSSGAGPARATRPRTARGPRRSRWGLAAVAATVLTTFVAVGLASNSALPGDPLYPIKRTLESVQLATAGSAADRGNQLLSQASTRLVEVQNLVDEHSSDPAVAVLMGGTLGDFSSQAHAGGDELMSAYRDDDDAGAIVDLRDFTSSSAQKLEGMSDQVPAAVLKDVAGAASELTTLDSTARAVCPTCSNLVPLALPANLQTLVSDVKAGRTPTLPNTPTDPADPGDPPTALTTPPFVAPPPVVIVPPAPGTDPVTLPSTEVPTTGPSLPSSSDPSAPTTDPVTTSPPTTDPGSTDPGTTDPGTTDPGTTDPGTTDPTTNDPVTTDPPSSDQAPTTQMTSTDPATESEQPTATDTTPTG
jgi:Domain of unknown function (DUF5667)